MTLKTCAKIAVILALEDYLFTDTPHTHTHTHTQHQKLFEYQGRCLRRQDVKIESAHSTTSTKCQMHLYLTNLAKQGFDFSQVHIV